MNSLDRVIGILYKETDFASFINEKMDLDEDDFSLLSEENRYNMKSGKFINQIKKVYLNKYKNNYTEDEIDVLLNWATDKRANLDVDLCSRNSEIVSYKSEYNSMEKNCYTGLDLIKYLTNKYLYRSNEEITVSFEELLDWSGYIDKLDYNVFYAAFLVFNNIDITQKNNHDLYINHDSDDLKKNLRLGMSENHMHLNGSGYTVDWSIFCFFTQSFLDMTFLSRNIESEHHFKNLTEKKEIDLAYAKLRVIHFYIWSLYKSTCEDYVLNENYKISKKEIYEVINYNYQEFKTLVIVRNPDSISLLDKLKYWQSDYLREFKKYEDEALAPIILQRLSYSVIFSLMHELEGNSLNNLIFNSYLMGVNQFKLLLIHTNNHSGFRQFKHHESLKANFIYDSDFFGKDYGEIENTIIKSVFDKYYREENVKYIEFRVVPSGFEKLQKLISKLDLINNETYEKLIKNRKTNLSEDGRQKIKYGLIFHYIKDGEEFEDKTMKYRKKDYIEKVKIQNQEVLSIFDYSSLNKNRAGYFDSQQTEYKTDDYYINKVLGIDAANYEIYCRPHLLKSVYKKHRGKNKTISNIHFTYHAGEDFNTIANGLRAIWEVVDTLEFRRSDRLGHASALGLSVDKYFDFKRNKIHTTLEDYIDDIAWMYTLMLPSEKNNHLHTFLEKEFNQYINDLLPRMYQGVTINDYMNSYKLRGNIPEYSEEEKDEIKNSINPLYNESVFNGQLKAKRLYLAYHLNEEYKCNAKKRLVIDASELYIESVKVIQKSLREKIIEKGINIETNPTSNYKISFIDKRIDMPLFSFNSRGLWDNKDGDIQVSINTDDSGIFQTNLSMEYSLVAATLLKEGYHYSDILEYVDYLRKSSLRQTFIK